MLEALMMKEKVDSKHWYAAGGGNIKWDLLSKAGNGMFLL